VEIGRRQKRQLTLERIRKVTIARINTLLDLPPEGALPAPPGRLAVSGPLPDVSQLWATALAGRPDLKALENRIRSEEAAVGLAHKEVYPDFEASAAYDTIMGNGPTRDLAPQLGLR
jgi:outer membrane protein TolC